MNYIKIILILFLMNFVFGGLVLFKIESQAKQNYNEYKMPFRWNETWDTKTINGRDNYGVHQDRTGYALDMYSPSDSTLDVLAPSNGTIIRGCSVGNATFLTFNSDYGDVFRFVHLRGDTTGLNNTNDSRRVSQGDVIGKVYGKGSFDSSTCSLSSEDSHVHFSWQASACPFAIEGYLFDCDGMQICYETYAVNCNRKYLNMSLKSSNGFSYDENKCNYLKTKNWIVGNTNNEIKYLQLCLNYKGLFDLQKENLGYFGRYTFTQLQTWKNESTNSNWQPKGVINLSKTEKSVFNYNTKNGQTTNIILDKNGEYLKSISLNTVGESWQFVASLDYNNDGIEDILWRNHDNGENHIWIMDNLGNRVKSAVLRNVDINTGWFIAGSGEFNGDGVNDILWRNSFTGEVHIWLIDKDSNYSRSIVLDAVSTYEWSVETVKDTNNDGISDILWRNYFNGDNHLWMMGKNSKKNQSTILRNVSPNSTWYIVGVGDFDKDSFGEVVWRNYITGEVHIWKLDKNFKYVNSYVLPNIGDEFNTQKNWNSILIADFNFDKVNDLLFKDTKSNKLKIWKLNPNFQLLDKAISLPTF
jgi:hypothetical protein